MAGEMHKMDLDAVKRSLEKGGDNSESIDGMPSGSFENFVLKGLSVDLIEPGRVLCSMKVPPRLLNGGNFLHGGATAAIVGTVSSAVTLTLGAPPTGVSVEFNVSFLDAAYVDEDIEIDAKALRVGKAIGVVTVDLRKKKTGKLIAQARHTKSLAVPSKL